MLSQDELQKFLQWIDTLDAETVRALRGTFHALFDAEHIRSAQEVKSRTEQHEQIERLKSTVAEADEEQLEAIRKKLGIG